MTGITEITNLSEYKTWVKQSLDHNKNATVFFYRGHGSINFEMQASVYRVIDGKSYRDSEYHLYQDMLHRNPSAFSEDKTIFEKLIRMQHYGLPTRLLDVTENSSVALFFACNEEREKAVDGKVFFFGTEKSKVIYADAISANTLAGLDIQLNISNIGLHILGEMNFFFDLQITSLYPTGYEKFDNNFRDLLVIFKNLLQQIDGTVDLMQIIAILRSFKTQETVNFNELQGELKKSSEAELNQDERIKILTARRALNDFMNAYYKFTRNTIVTLCEKMHIPYSHEWNDSLGEFLASFTYFNFVYPPLNNERIRRQQGAFVIFPPAQSSWTLEMHQSSLSVVVKAEAKQKLLDELARAGITEDYLFPELDKQAKAARQRYPMSEVITGLNHD
ncbi:MAG: hypothetical protein RLZ75_942 [Pseudomonadota bacterium]